MSAPLDTRKAWLGKGWSTPVRIAPDSGRVVLVAYEADIREAIAIILGTSRGERVMRPDFGCGIHDLVYNVIDVSLLTRVETEVRESLVAFEPRIELMGVRADPYRAADGVLLVEIDYRVRKTNQTGNLVFPFYFREGGPGLAQETRR